MRLACTLLRSGRTLTANLAGRVHQHRAVGPVAPLEVEHVRERLRARLVVGAGALLRARREKLKAAPSSRAVWTREARVRRRWPQVSSHVWADWRGESVSM